MDTWVLKPAARRGLPQETITQMDLAVAAKKLELQNTLDGLVTQLGKKRKDRTKLEKDNALVIGNYNGAKKGLEDARAGLVAREKDVRVANKKKTVVERHVAEHRDVVFTKKVKGKGGIETQTETVTWQEAEKLLPTISANRDRDILREQAARELITERQRTVETARTADAVNLVGGTIQTHEAIALIDATNREITTLQGQVSELRKQAAKLKITLRGDKVKADDEAPRNEQAERQAQQNAMLQALRVRQGGPLNKSTVDDFEVAD